MVTRSRIPEHVAPQVIEAITVAARRGLRLPIVCNTSAYGSIRSIEMPDGIVADAQVLTHPDKYADIARTPSTAELDGAPSAARAAGMRRFDERRPRLFILDA